MSKRLPTAAQALDSAARVMISILVVTDVMMPELDGFGLLEAVRANPSMRELPVLMLSARAGEDRDDRRPAGRRGATTWSSHFPRGN